MTSRILLKQIYWPISLHLVILFTNGQSRSVNNTKAVAEATLSPHQLGEYAGVSKNDELDLAWKVQLARLKLEDKFLEPTLRTHLKLPTPMKQQRCDTS
jgi:hypothetical protein